ncbi:hypothetical protein PUR49_08870 [Streptomyces sp. BE147]|uniref:hypothetical protein n=1 Tax=Streptomyces sp. BE147 TaxID=3002524 RepID=UPI002E7925EE|nr:hypothetical protein [Streptomyces sp. BE147]MEE1736613.1 hypothetical protein [Streptomyces sp. BE147]
MNTRLTRALASVTFMLAVLSGLAFVGTGFTHMIDDGGKIMREGVRMREDLEGAI